MQMFASCNQLISRDGNDVPQIIIPPDIKRAPVPERTDAVRLYWAAASLFTAAFPPRMGFQPRIDSPISSLPRVRDVAHLSGFGIRYDRQHTDRIGSGNLRPVPGRRGRPPHRSCRPFGGVHSRLAVARTKTRSQTTRSLQEPILPAYWVLSMIPALVDPTNSVGAPGRDGAVRWT